MTRHIIHIADDIFLIDGDIHREGTIEVDIIALHKREFLVRFRLILHEAPGSIRIPWIRKNHADDLITAVLCISHHRETLDPYTGKQDGDQQEQDDDAPAHDMPFIAIPRIIVAVKILICHSIRSFCLYSLICRQFSAFLYVTHVVDSLLYHKKKSFATGKALNTYIGSSSRICRETDSASPISAISSMSEVPP